MDHQKTTEAARRLLKAQLRTMLFTSLSKQNPDVEKWGSLLEVAQGALSDAQEAWKPILASWDLDSPEASAQLEAIGKDALQQAIQHMRSSMAAHLDGDWMKGELREFTASFTVQNLLG